MNEKIKISYAITVKDELEEVIRLLNMLPPKIQQDDEILIQYDEDGVTDEVMDFLNVFEQMHKNAKVVSFPLNKDFGTFKSNLSKEASGDYIFQLDADEIPHEFLLEYLPQLLHENDEVDMFFVPRVNTVDDITQRHIDMWNWSVRTFEDLTNSKEIDQKSDEYKFLESNNYILAESVENDEIEYLVPIINFPDYQTRIYKNTDEVKWIGKVHESITGYSTFSSLPAERRFCINHPKGIERQEKQNEFYETI